MQSFQFRRPREAFRASGYSKTSYYRQVAEGLQPPFVRLGKNAVAVPVHEQTAVNAARAAGKTDDEIRALVATLIAARQTYFEKIDITGRRPDASSTPIRKGPETEHVPASSPAETLTQSERLEASTAAPSSDSPRSTADPKVY